MRFDRAAELWAAISISLLAHRARRPDPRRAAKRLGAIIVLVIAFVVGESVLRGTFVRTVNRLAVILALVAVVVLFAHYWKLVARRAPRRARRFPPLPAAPRAPSLTAESSCLSLLDLVTGDGARRGTFEPSTPG